jgi:5-(aminomethyl)-3-furanmethanol phosphate kinase
MQPNVPLRIIKLGGSLLCLEDLRPRFDAWLETQPPARNLVVVGGGEAVEAIRELDVIHRFPAHLTHWICVDLMSVNAALAGELLGIGTPISTELELNAFMSGSTAISSIACIQPTAYYTPSIAMQRRCNLPESWLCTSDSIAAWLANSLAADQLVLLKSVDDQLESNVSLTAEAIRNLADLGTVDPIFPQASQGLPDVRVVSLRNAMQAK